MEGEVNLSSALGTYTVSLSQSELNSLNGKVIIPGTLAVTQNGSTEEHSICLMVRDAMEIRTIKSSPLGNIKTLHAGPHALLVKVAPPGMVPLHEFILEFEWISGFNLRERFTRGNSSPPFEVVYDSKQGKKILIYLQE